MLISDLIAALEEIKRDAGGYDFPVLLASESDDFWHRVRKVDIRQDGKAVIISRGEIIVRVGDEDINLGILRRLC